MSIIIQSIVKRVFTLYIDTCMHVVWGSCGLISLCRQNSLRNNCIMYLGL